MRKYLFSVITIVLFLSVMVSGSWALNVALLEADSGFGAVEDYLVGTGMFAPGDITYYNVSVGNPTLETLMGYDSVMVWSNSLFYNSTALGNVLADYVDAGGGVVMASFSFYGYVDVSIAGRITDYSPFNTPGTTSFTSSTLGTYNAAHPIMDGVTSLGGSYRDNVTLKPGADLVASWADGRPLAATGNGGSVVGISLYPGESIMTGLSGDYAQLFANALYYSADAQVVPEPGSIMALLLGVGALGGLVRRRK